ncbi:MAG: efflux RND transporter periplasmic adaptor subunit [Deltaproteobacteria bacterium]|nr:efflux RND transporter periplasmic adaptor subunit [Deltaproteobacteria bacterium]
MKLKTTIMIAAVVVAGLVAALFITHMDKPSVANGPHGDAEDAAENTVKGPHGGRLLSDGDFKTEITIYEKGVPPQFRVYAYEKENKVSPEEVKLTIELHRLGGSVDRILFRKEGDYLRGDKVVEEPHSFDVKINASYKGKSSKWEYSQVEGRVEMAPEIAAAAGIEIKQAGPASIRTTLELPGEVVLNKNRVAHIVPRLSGVVIEVRKNLGDRVRKGEVIAVIDSRELAEAKREYIESVHRLHFAQSSFVREEGLWKKRVSAEEDYLASRHNLEEAEISKQVALQKLLSLGVSAGEIKMLSIEPEGDVIQHEVRVPFSNKTLTRYEITAPLDGVVIEKNISIGEAVKEDSDMFVVADLSTLWCEITVYAKDLGIVTAGQRVNVEASALGLKSAGKISYIGPLVGEQTRSAKAYVDIPNPKGEWRPGLFATVEVVQEEKKAPVAVAAEAIQTLRDWSVVFVRYGNLFEARPLELGRSDGQHVEVLSGLAPGEKYASHNSFVIKAELGKAGASHDH